MGIIYEWKPQARLHNLDPQKVGETLQKIEKTKGTLTPHLVLAAARNPKSPLHQGFQWDDTVAAEEYRLSQARYMLRSLVVVAKTEPGCADIRNNPIRAYVVVGSDVDRRYTSVYAALADPEQRRQVLRQAMRELAAWQRKYEELDELASVFQAAQLVSEELQQK